MTKVIDDYVLHVSDGSATLTHAAGLAVDRAAPAGLFFALSLAGAVGLPIGVVTSGEWEAMATADRAISAFAVLALWGFVAVFGRSLYFATDRTFRLHASSDGIAIRVHRFRSVFIPRADIRTIVARGRTFRPQGQVRYCIAQVGYQRVGPPQEAFERLFGVGGGPRTGRDTEARRAEVSAMAQELAEALALALDVPCEWRGFSAAAA